MALSKLISPAIDPAAVEHFRARTRTGAPVADAQLDAMAAALPGAKSAANQLAMARTSLADEPLRLRALATRLGRARCPRPRPRPGLCPRGIEKLRRATYAPPPPATTSGAQLEAEIRGRLAAMTRPSATTLSPRPTIRWPVPCSARAHRRGWRAWTKASASCADRLGGARAIPTSATGSKGWRRPSRLWTVAAQLWLRWSPPLSRTSPPPPRRPRPKLSRGRRRPRYEHPRSTRHRRQPRYRPCRGPRML